MSRAPLLLIGLALMALSAVVQAACGGSGAALTAANATQAEVQACIDKVPANNASLVTISIPPGSQSWSSGVNWTNKRIHLKGSGIGSTVIRCQPCVSITMNGAHAGQTNDSRISGFTFTGSSGGAVINLYATSAPGFVKGWRIDNNRFYYSGAGQCTFVYGTTWGLIDSNTYDVDSGQDPCYPLYSYGYIDAEYPTSSSRLYGDFYWSRPVNLGSDEAIYMENNIFNFGSWYDHFPFDFTMGGSVVFRFNTCTNCYVQTHSARYDVRGGMKYEVYRNTFVTAPNRFALMRSGTGVFFQNRVTGPSQSIDLDTQRVPSGACAVSGAPLGACTGSFARDGNIEPSGWPCLDQPGRAGVASGNVGGNTASPVFGWRNGTQATCRDNSGACDQATQIGTNGGCGSIINTYVKSTAHSNGDVDYVNSARIASGPRSSRPASCSKWDAYWATDQGNWNGQDDAANGCLDVCTGTNTWTSCWYTPYKYPHPTRVGAGGVSPAAPANLRVLQ